MQQFGCVGALNSADSPRRCVHLIYIDRRAAEVTLTAIALNCSLKASGDEESSSTDKMISLVTANWPNATCTWPARSFADTM
jgi:hypothetical protein